MKINNTKNRTKNILIIAVSFIGILLLVSAYIFFIKPSSVDQNTELIDPPTTQQQENGTSIKNNSLNSSGKPGSGGSDKPPEATPIPNSTKSSVGMTITSTSPQSGTTIYINSFIDTVTSSGECTLSFSATSSSTVVTKTASVQPGSSTSACMGFSIPKNELSLGEWTATIKFSNDSLVGEVTKKIVIE